MTGRGRYVDGRSAARHEVLVSVTADVLELSPANAGGVLARWPVASLAFLDEPVPGIVRLTSSASPDARLELDDPALVQMLTALAPSLHHRREAQRRRWWPIVAGGVIAAPLVLGATVWVLQWLVVAVVPFIPMEWERPLGTLVRASLTEDAPECRSPAGRAALDRLVQRLRRGDADGAPLDVQVVARDVTNAFALPGGGVVVFEGLLRRARTPDELAGVLAHELAHVRRRHVTASVLRAVGLQVLIDWALGGTTGAHIGGALLQLSHSRAAEEEADRDAVRMLEQAGVRTDGLARFFERLEAEHPDVPGFPTILSTHPPTAERRALAERHARTGESALSITDWRALRKICRGAKPAR